MGEAKRRKLAAPKLRTVGDIIAGRAPGVFGMIASIEKGRMINGWFPSLLVTLSEPVGLPLCSCKSRTPHALIEYAPIPCSQEHLDGEFARIIEAQDEGYGVALAGDIVQVYEPDNGLPLLVSAFSYLRGIDYDWTVPDRSGAISQHCSCCPIILHT